MYDVGGSSSGADSGYSDLVPNLVSMEDFLSASRRAARQNKARPLPSASLRTLRLPPPSLLLPPPSLHTHHHLSSPRPRPRPHQMLVVKFYSMRCRACLRIAANYRRLARKCADDVYDILYAMSCPRQWLTSTPSSTPQVYGGEVSATR